MYAVVEKCLLLLLPVCMTDRLHDALRTFLKAPIRWENAADGGGRCFVPVII